jgi:hypothetical protein
MSTLSRAIGPAFAICLLSACCAPTALKPPPDGSVRVSDLVKEVQNAIDPFWQDPAHPGSLPPIASVKIALQTVHDTRLSGEVDYLVVALKGYYDNAYTQEVDITLAPQKPSAEKARALTAGEALRAAIEGVQKEVQASYTSDAGHTLNTQEVDVQVCFAVTWDASLGANKWAISPISLTASGELSLKTVNTITVAFKVPAPAPGAGGA